jgi:hypothetical protein
VAKRGTRAATGRSSVDEILELYRKDVDRTLLRENLRLTPDERIRKMIAALEFIEELRRAPKTFSR